MEERRYTFTWAYVVTPIAMAAVGWGIVFVSRPPASVKDYLLFLGVALFFGMLFLVLRFGTYCVLTKSGFCRVSYFVLKNRIPLDAIHEIRLRPTYGFGKEVMSLWIIGSDNGYPCAI